MLRQMTAAMRVAAKPLVTAVKAAAEQKLPHRGGLNTRVAKARVTVSVRTGARTAGVRLYTRDTDTRATDHGYVRHPTFGRRTGPNDWHDQSIPQAEGWWSQTLADESPGATPELMAVMRRVGDEIQGRGL